MGVPRQLASRLLSVGVLSRGWYAVLTGLAMLYVAFVLGSISSDADPAAPLAAVAFAVLGLWQLERGLRAELQRRPRSSDEAR